MTFSLSEAAVFCSSVSTTSCGMLIVLTVPTGGCCTGGLRCPCSAISCLAISSNIPSASICAKISKARSSSISSSLARALGVGSTPVWIKDTACSNSGSSSPSTVVAGAPFPLTDWSTFCPVETTPFRLDVVAPAVGCPPLGWLTTLVLVPPVGALGLATLGAPLRLSLAFATVAGSSVDTRLLYAASSTLPL